MRKDKGPCGKTFKAHNAPNKEQRRVNHKMDAVGRVVLEGGDTDVILTVPERRPCLGNLLWCHRHPAPIYSTKLIDAEI